MASVPDFLSATKPTTSVPSGSVFRSRRGGLSIAADMGEGKGVSSGGLEGSEDPERMTIPSVDGDPLTAEETDLLDRSIKRVCIIRDRLDGCVARDPSVSQEMEDEGKRKFSYSDMVMEGRATLIVVQESPKPMEEKVVFSDLEDDILIEGDNIHFTNDQLKIFRALLRSALILKVLGKRVGYQYL